MENQTEKQKSDKSKRGLRKRIIINVYDKIEKDIKTTDFYTRESFLLDVLYTVFVLVLAGLVWLIMYYKIIGWTVFAVSIVSTIIIWYIGNFKIIYDISHSTELKELQPFNSLQKSDLLKFKTVIALMSKLKNTNPNVVEIIKKYGVKTKEGLEEAIDHFRFKVLSTREWRLDILAFLALATSVAGYFLNKIDLPQDILLIIFTVILTLCFFTYLAVLSILNVSLYSMVKKHFISE